MKKIIMGVMVLLVGFLMITGCGKNESSNEEYKKDQINGLKQLDYNISDSFREVDDSSAAIKYAYSSNGMECYLSIQTFNKVSSSSVTKDSLIDSIENYLIDGYKVSVKDENIFNGIDAKHIQTVNEVNDELSFIDRTDYYFIENDNYVYKISYNVVDAAKGNRDDLDSHVCTTSIEPFMNSVSFK